jgi:hypothetical protein
VMINQGIETPPVLRGHALQPDRMGDDRLNHQRIDEDETILHEMLDLFRLQWLNP